MLEKSYTWWNLLFILIVYNINLPILNIDFIPHFLFSLVQFYFVIFLMMLSKMPSIPYSAYIHVLVRVYYLLFHG